MWTNDQTGSAGGKLQWTVILLSIVMTVHAIAESSRHGAAESRAKGVELNGSESPLATSSTAGSYLRVPWVEHTLTADGTTTKADVTVRNTRNAAQVIMVVFLRAGQDNFKTRNEDDIFRTTLPPGSAVTLEDVVALLKTEGEGSLIIMADPYDPEARLTAACRLYVTRPDSAGSVSQSADAVDSIHWTSSSSAVVTGLIQDATFHTDVGIFNHDYSERTFRVLLDGEPSWTPIDLKVPSFSALKVPLPPGDFGRMRIRFETADGLTGSFVSFGSSTDKVTGDGWMQIAVPVP